MRPIGLSEPFIEIDATGDAVGIQVHMNMTQPCGHIGQIGQRHGLRQHAAKALLLQYHRHEDPVTGGHRLDQVDIRFRVGTQGFREQDIEYDGLGPRQSQLLDELGMHFTGPGPAAQRIQALLVHCHDDDIFGGLTGEETQMKIIEQLVPAPEPATGRQQSGEQQCNEGTTKTLGKSACLSAQLSVLEARESLGLVNDRTRCSATGTRAC